MRVREWYGVCGLVFRVIHHLVVAPQFTFHVSRVGVTVSYRQDRECPSERVISDPVMNADHL